MLYLQTHLLSALVKSSAILHQQHEEIFEPAKISPLSDKLNETSNQTQTDLSDPKHNSVYLPLMFRLSSIQY